jgi:hypothetical protein
MVFTGLPLESMQPDIAACAEFLRSSAPESMIEANFTRKTIIASSLERNLRGFSFHFSLFFLFVFIMIELGEVSLPPQSHLSASATKDFSHGAQERREAVRKRSMKRAFMITFLSPASSNQIPTVFLSRSRAFLHITRSPSRVESTRVSSARSDHYNFILAVESIFFSGSGGFR